MKNELSFFWNDWASNRELIWLSASTSSSYYRCYLPYIWIITEDLSEFVTTYCFLTIHPRRGEGPIGKLCLPGEGGIRDLFSEILPVILQSFNFQNGGGGAHPTPFIVPRTNLHFIHHILQHIITYWNIRMFWRWNLNNWL